MGSTEFDNISINDIKLERVSNYKYLGIIIDDQLSWKPHTEAVIKKIAINIGRIRKIKDLLPKNILILLYYALIQSYLSYRIPVWHNCPKLTFNKLSILQKRYIRLCYNLPWYTHVNKLLTFNSILTAENLAILRTSLQVFNYKSVNSNLNFLVKFSEIHNYNTRNKNNFNLPQMTRAKSQKAFSYIGAKYWNNLPNSLKQIESKNLFTQKLKHHLLKNQLENF